MINVKILYKINNVGFSMLLKCVTLELCDNNCRKGNIIYLQLSRSILKTCYDVKKKITIYIVNNFLIRICYCLL